MKKLMPFIVVLIFLFCLSACINDEAVNIGTENHTEESTTSYDYYKSDVEVFEIKTGHCSLYFPEKWKDNVVTTVSEDGAICKVSFSAVFGDRIIPLYDFIFGDTVEGYLLGNIDTDGGVQSIYLADKSDSYDGNLSEEQENIYFDMVEGVNDIISNLVYVSGLKLAQ